MMKLSQQDLLKHAMKFPRLLAEEKMKICLPVTKLSIDAGK